MIGEHSAKPGEVRNRIERLFGNVSRIELFARPESPMFPKPDGWHWWGNEVESDIQLSTISVGFNEGLIEAERKDT